MRMSEPRRPSLSFRSVNVPGLPGYSPGLQRHHLLPRQLLGRKAFAALEGVLGQERLGFHDFRRNGMLLPASEDSAIRIGLPMHRGPHPRYNEVVIERAGTIEARWSRQRGTIAADVEAMMRFDLLQKALRRRLLDPKHWRNMPLNRHDPALDFSHLDRMAEMLWGDTDAPF